jgi:CRISPR/Cas system-associated exonuclease Cas4 (RecB family)
MTAALMTLDFTASHTVYKNAAGKRVPGVTTVLGLLNKPALLKWAWQCGKDGLELERTRQAAADIGTVAHALCEAHLRGMDLDKSNIAPDVVDKAETSFIRFLDWWDREQLEMVHSELGLVSESMQVGGTLDVLARRPDGRLCVIDLKTSKGIYDEMLIQAATYAAMYEENHGVTVDDVFIVRIGKEIADDLEVRPVTQREERVEAFRALAGARRLLQKAGVRV